MISPTFARAGRLSSWHAFQRLPSLIRLRVCSPEGGFRGNPVQPLKCSGRLRPTATTRPGAFDYDLSNRDIRHADSNASPIDVLDSLDFFDSFDHLLKV